MEFILKIKPYLSRIEQGIDRYAPKANTRPERLHQAMRYSLEAGGKRLRPLLAILGSELFPNTHDPIPAAVAIECVHTYSLIHDDLPCMDDSDLRRGRPSCHVAFDEATALLAGDALLTLAFDLLSSNYETDPVLALALIQDLSKSAGSQALIAGQMEDFLGEQSTHQHATPTIDSPSFDLTYINAMKTGVMIGNSFQMGARFATSDTNIIANSYLIGMHIGLAYQIVDDILDEVSSEAVLGKSVKMDDKNNKITWPKLYGMDESKNAVHMNTQMALKICRSIGGNNALILELIEELQQRIC